MFIWFQYTGLNYCLNNTITINENKYTQASSGLADTFSHDNDQNVCSLDQKHSRCFTFLNMNSHFVIFQIVIYQIS